MTDTPDSPTPTATTSGVHLRDLLVSTQINGWTLETVMVPAEDGKPGTLTVVATKVDHPTVNSPVTPIMGGVNVIEVWVALAMAVLTQCH